MRNPSPPNADLLERAWRYRVNRFRGTSWRTSPSRSPSTICSGFDEQKLDAEGVPRKFFNPELTGPEGDEISGYPVYLDGVLRQKSWKSYYLKALAYKVPEGTMALVFLSMALLVFSPRSRAAGSMS